ncbi:MAG TPA: hypothetical protein VF787_04485 [Thermoanaerobaculia bacterium]
MIRLVIFGVGLIAGAAMKHKWRSIAKEGIKTGVRASRKIREISEEAMEELEDVAADAMAELDAEEQHAAEASAGGDIHGHGPSN